jgi:hypothetical protein
MSYLELSGEEEEDACYSWAKWEMRTGGRKQVGARRR